MYKFNRDDGGCSRYNRRNDVLAASPRDYASRHKMKGNEGAYQSYLRDCSLSPGSPGGSGRTSSQA